MFLVFGFGIYESYGGVEDLISIYYEYEDFIDSLGNTNVKWWNCLDVVQVINTDTKSFFIWEKDSNIDLVEFIKTVHWQNIDTIISKEHLKVGKYEQR